MIAQEEQQVKYPNRSEDLVMEDYDQEEIYKLYKESEEAKQKRFKQTPERYHYQYHYHYITIIIIIITIIIITSQSLSLSLHHNHYHYHHNHYHNHH